MKKTAKPKDTAIVAVAEKKPALSVPALISQGLATGASMEAMKGLYELYALERDDQRRMAFNEAMADFQSDCPVIKKNKSGGKTNAGVVAYYFAPIDSIVSQVKDLIRKHGFSYFIKTTTENGKLTATCIVRHKLGWSEESSFTVGETAGTAVMSGPQKTAASLTFAKRYAFCNAFGIMTGDQDIDTSKAPDASAENGKTQFQLAEELIKAATAPSRLIELRKHVNDSKEFTNQEKVKLMGMCNEKLNAKK
jgi:hypothetical protein